MSENPGGASFRDFTLVEDDGEAKDLLAEGARLSSALQFWTTGQSHLIKGTFGKHEPLERSFYVNLPKKSGIDAFVSDFRRGIFKECLFSVGLVSAHIFFKARFSRQDTVGLRFHEPDAVYKVQRRKTLRYAFSEKTRPALSIGDRKRPILDVSSGGICFFATAQEAKFYTTGSKINDCSFKIGDRKIVFDAEIRHNFQPIRLDESSTGIRIGAQFKKLSAADDQFISGYVFEETRKLLAKVL